MSSNYGNEIPLSEDWSAKTLLERNSSGELVITGLQVLAKTEKAKETGISSSVIRGIKISDLISESISDLEYFGLLAIGYGPYDWAIETRLMWMAEIAGEWERKGPVAHDESLYAKTAFFYVMELTENKTSPLQSLAVKLEVDRQTLARRVEKARKLGLLTSPASKSGSSGVPGGALTKKAIELLNANIEEKI